MSIEEIFEIVDDKHRLVRAIFSGRRRNMQPRFEKVEIRPVDIKDSLMLQVITQIRDESTTTNIEFGSFATNETLMSGYANCLVEATDKTFTVRFTKKVALKFIKTKNQTLKPHHTIVRKLDCSTPVANS